MADEHRDDVPGESRTEPLTSGAGGAAPPRPQGVSLMIYSCDGVKVAQLTSGKDLVVGRSKTTDVPVRDKSLSQRHALFTLLEDGIRVTDLGSTNGTWIAGKQISSDNLELSGEVTLGKVLVKVFGLGIATDPTVAGEEPFRRRLYEEVKRARHFGRTFAVLAARTSNLEAAVAWMEQLRARLQSVDRVCLYTPNTVLILLSELGADEAHEKAREIALGAADLDSPLLIGVAMYPAAASTVEKLIDLAREEASRASPEKPIAIASMAVSRESSEDDEMINGEAQQKLLFEAKRASTGSAPVVLHGETGTGKEVWAKFIHRKGPRRDKRLVCVNCGAIQASLVESTLFGHEKGAFTGAMQQQRGVFEDADKGTLFLDEIGELPAAAQAALLRVLETGSFSRVGSTREVAVDVRVIAATHRDLMQMVKEGNFRQDLYYRLSRVVLTIPPLRERRDEIEPLAQRFLARANQESSRGVQGFSEEAMALLRAYRWPGNVRELRNVVERAVLMGRDELIQPADLVLSYPVSEQREEVVVEATTMASAKKLGHQIEANAIEKALKENNWNRAAAAKQLGMPLRTLARRIKELGIREPPKR